MLDDTAARKLAQARPSYAHTLLANFAPIKKFEENTESCTACLADVPSIYQKLVKEIDTYNP